MFSVIFDQYNTYKRLFNGKFYGDKLPHKGWQNALHVCSMNCIWSIIVEMFNIFSSQECIVCVYTETDIQKQTHKQSSLKWKIWQPVLYITISTSQYSSKSTIKSSCKMLMFHVYFFNHPILIHHAIVYYSHITLQPKTGCPLKLSRVEPGQYLD